MTSLSSMDHQYLTEAFTSPEGLELQRKQYLDSLIEPQELYSELLVHEGKGYSISDNGVNIGYFIVREHEIVEFYLSNRYYFAMERIFSQIIQEYSITGSMVKSFDFPLMNLSHQFFKNSHPDGYLFRHSLPNEGIHTSPVCDIQRRHCANSDIPVILEMSGDFFSGAEELTRIISREEIFIYEKESILYGIGLCQRTHPNYNWYDIGMIIHPSFRRIGLGSYIFQDMKQYSIHQGGFPTAGCGCDNHGSRRCIEKSGFYLGHLFIHFTQ